LQPFADFAAAMELEMELEAKNSGASAT